MKTTHKPERVGALLRELFPSGVPASSFNVLPGILAALNELLAYSDAQRVEEPRPSLGDPLMDMIRTAIEQHRYLHFDYNGGPRTVEPVRLGITRAGAAVLRAFQTSGFSNSGSEEGWKIFRLDEMADVRLGLGYSRPVPTDTVFTTILCDVGGPDHETKGKR